MSQGIAHEAGLLFLTSQVPGAVTPTTVRWRGGYYQHDGAAYRPVSDEALEAAVTTWLAANVGARTDPASNKVSPITTSLVRDVMLAVRAHSQIPDATEPGTWLQGVPAGAVGPFLATPAGVLDLGSLATGPATLLAASPTFFTLTALPVAPAPAASCSVWPQFLRETFAGDMTAIDLLQETFGYCLLNDCRFEKFFLLYGPANSGKGTVAEMLQRLLGAAHVSALPLERLGQQFALANLVGKLASIVFDGGDVTCAAEGTFKALVSGESVDVDEKHKAVRTIRLTAKHLILTNHLPTFTDTSDGVWRRLVLLPFERVCPPESRDPGLKQRLRAELPAIAHWALEGLGRLLRQGHFTACERGARLAAEHRKECNPVALFLDEECVLDPDGRVGRKRLYGCFTAWAQASGHRPMTRNKFYAAVRAVCPQPDEDLREGRGGDRVFVGLRPRQPGELLHRFRVLSPYREEGL